MSLTVVVPIYNEAESLPAVLNHLITFCKENEFELLLVNDGSKDETKNIINSLNAREEFHVIHHQINRGYGAALKSGILGTTTEFVITVDADGQHRCEDILNLYTKIRETGADMIVGGRKGPLNGSFMRAIGKGIIRFFVRVMITVSIHDINSGMKIYQTSLAKKFLRLAPNTMAFSDIMAITFIYFGCYVVEVPIQINNRVAGKSTINYKTALDTIKEILFIATVFAPYRFFSWLAASILGITLLWGIPFILAGKGFTSGTVSGILIAVLLWTLGVIAHLISGVRKDLVLNT